MSGSIRTFKLFGTCSCRWKQLNVDVLLVKSMVQELFTWLRSKCVLVADGNPSIVCPVVMLYQYDEVCIAHRCCKQTPAISGITRDVKLDFVCNR